jgi:hypothetical protein
MRNPGAGQGSPLPGLKHWNSKSAGEGVDKSDSDSNDTATSYCILTKGIQLGL